MRQKLDEAEGAVRELRAVNQELRTANAELERRVDSIASAHVELQELVSSAEVSAVLLDAELQIRRFTSAGARVLGLTDADVGRPIGEFTHRVNCPSLPEDAARALHEHKRVERETETQNGAPLLLRVRPCETTDGRIEGVVLTVIDERERRAARADLHASDARFRALVNATSNVIYCMSSDWQEMKALSGGGLLSDTTEPARDWLDTYISEEDREQVRERIAAAIESKTPFDFEHRVRRADGSIGWVQSRAVPILGEDGSIQEWFGAATDVTERLRNEEARNLLIRELNHRVKNMLAVVQSIAAQTRRASPSMDQFVVAFESRIRALAGAHRLLTRSQWTTIALADLAQAAVSSFLSRRTEGVRIHGPYAALRPDAGIAVAMALHELGTNAVKYGALGAPAGSLEIGWTVDGDAAEGERVVLTWSERGGPEVAPPRTEGFGMRLLKRGLARELDGRVELEFRPEGLHCRMEFPVEHDAAK